MEPCRISYRQELSKLSREELIDYAEVMAGKNFWSLQNNWMMAMSQRFGPEITVEFDALVFGRNSEVQGWRLKKLFNLGDDIPSLMKAMNYSTILCNVEWEYLEATDRHCRLRVIQCRQQLERRKAGLPELPCKRAGIEINRRFAAAINPRFKTTCVLCPPDAHSDNCWCEWLFEL